MSNLEYIRTWVKSDENITDNSDKIQSFKEKYCINMDNACKHSNKMSVIWLHFNMFLILKMGTEEFPPQPSYLILIKLANQAVSYLRH